MLGVLNGDLVVRFLMARGDRDRLARFLPPLTARERAVMSYLHASPSGPVEGASLPARIGQVRFSVLNGMVAVRCPSDLAPLMRRAGGEWEPGSQRWLIKRRRIGPLIRNLHRVIDPKRRPERPVSVCPRD
jgi:hypothetical protein